MNRDKFTLDRVKSTYSFWGKFSGLYGASGVVTYLGREYFLRSRAAFRIGLKPGDKVLDVACGTGRNFPYLVDKVGPEGKVVGFDYTREMLDAAERLCNKKGWRNVKLVQGDATELDVRETNFDGAMSVLGISAIPGYERALGRVKDVLRPGGVLSVLDARLFSGPLSILNPIVKQVYGSWAVWDYSKDIPEKMNEIFGNVQVGSFNFGTMYIAVSMKGE